jgi:hypothetical protein
MNGLNWTNTIPSPQLHHPGQGLKHWPALLFKEALTIHRQKLELNRGIKASRELLVFY